MLHKAPCTHGRSTRNNKPGILPAINLVAQTEKELLQEIEKQIDNIQATAQQRVIEIHSPAPPQRVAPHDNPVRVGVESILHKNRNIKVKLITPQNRNFRVNSIIPQNRFF